MTGCDLGSPVTGDPSQAPTDDFEQAEAVAALAEDNGGDIVVVSFNDRTNVDAANPTWIYPDGPSGTQRIVMRGASLMGWSYSTDYGSTFTYGGKVPPPLGWSVMWGDPAVAAVQDDRSIVYIANLGGSDVIFPASGQLVNSGPTLDGFCVSRSTTGGVTFNEVACFKRGTCSNSGALCTGAITDCLNPPPNPPGVCNGLFYDGTDLASFDTTVFFAATAVNPGQMHVYSSDSDVVNFQPLDDLSPFDSFRMFRHPRLKVWSSRLYIVGQNNNGFPMLSSIALPLGPASTWTPPLVISFAVASGPVDLGDGTAMRLANNFSYDIGINSEDNVQELRIMIGRQTPTGRFHVETTQCPLPITENPQQPGTAFCFGGDQANRWGGPNHDTSAHEFLPQIRAAPIAGGIASRWNSSYLNRELNSPLVSVDRAALITLAGVNVLAQLPLVSGQDPCSYPSAGGDYWGDYNDLIVMPAVPGGTNPRFLAPFTRDTDGCAFDGNWTADMHVGAAVFE